MTVSEIEQIIIDCQIKINGEYAINSEGLVDVDGNVQFDNFNCDKLPLMFGVVTGNFSICNIELLTLEGCPTYVGGYFQCYGNKLKNLKHGPKYVGGEYNCALNRLKNFEEFECFGFKAFYIFSNDFISLKGCPNIIYGDFYCYQNKLENLIGMPTRIDGTFIFDFFLKSLFTNVRNFNIKAIEIYENIHFNYNRLPDVFHPFSERMELVFKYQYLYELWSEDYTLNEDNFNLFLQDVDEGLC